MIFLYMFSNQQMWIQEIYGNLDPED
jgi:hypothetical protein